MSSAPKELWTAQEYLAFERKSTEKHEFLDGEIYLMSGGTANHNLIIGNLYASLHSQLRQSPCLVYPSDMRVKVNASGLYTYPDVSVVCEPPRYEDAQRDTLLNPTVIVEVLSPSSENYDRGKKFQLYRALDSLQEYILVSQDSVRIERFLRQPDGQWLFADAADLGARLELPSIGCTLLLSDVYEKVVFESDDK